ncbi:MAG TPA: tetratricopeptide repeat protein [Candidatus Portnoybacteria bacterium]|nr:tetratricopeptide repeat protein [Candidatus Portnoybacteria bacterium]
MSGTIKIISILSELFLAFGIIGILVIIFRKIPILASLPKRPEVVLPKTPILKKLQKKIAEIKESDLKVKFLFSVEKGIRKFRLFFLKTDNSLMLLVKKVQDQAEIWRTSSKNFLIRQQAKKLERIKTLEKIEREEVKELISETRNEAHNSKDEDHKSKDEKIKDFYLGKKEKNKNIFSKKTSGEILKEPGQRSEVDIKNKNQTNQAWQDDADQEKRLIKLITEDPKNGEYYYQLGIFYVHQKSFQDAKKCFQQVLKLDQENEKAQRRLGEIKKLEE